MKSKTAVLSLCTAIGLLSAGCGPPKVPTTVEIQPNETVWVIPMDALGGDQAKFNSVDYLEKRKVAAKRVWVDKVIRSTGRMWFDYEWIDAVRVITVDRSLVTREWTVDNQGIPVVTRDSVELTVGLTTTANIEEDDASTYLYYHGAKKLLDVVDTNVRSFAVAELTRQYSQMSLSEAQTNGVRIYAQLFNDAKAFFKSKGITVQYLGNAEGWRYKNQKIQDSINANYIAEQDNKTAINQQTAQNTRNQTKVNIAEAEANAANKLFAAQEATKFQVELQVRTMEAQARLSMATNWNGKLPENILPEGSPLLMQLGALEKPTPVAQK